MSKLFLFTSLSILVAISLITTGCSKEPASQKPPASPETSQDQPMATGHEHGEGEHATHGESDDAFAELTPEDRALAEEQKTCPVSSDPLGAMGKPYKVTIEGRDVFLCCQGCETKIKENPEKYLANLPK